VCRCLTSRTGITVPYVFWDVLLDIPSLTKQPISQRTFVSHWMDLAYRKLDNRTLCELRLRIIDQRDGVYIPARLGSLTMTAAPRLLCDMCPEFPHMCIWRSSASIRRCSRRDLEFSHHHRSPHCTCIDRKGRSTLSIIRSRQLRHHILRMGPGLYLLHWLVATSVRLLCDRNGHLNGRGM
jgi:hypothetical protein